MTHQKVGLFAWRLFRDRLPTTDNLICRGVIHHDACLCVTRCGSKENLAHLFLRCNIFGSIWYHIYKWMGVSTVIPFSVGDHFNQFTIDGGVTKARRSILQVLWYATTWEIWKERNNRLFNGKECSIVQVVDKFKSLTFMWLNAKFPSLPFNYHSWWLNSFTMLGID